MEMRPLGWDDPVEARIRELNDALDVLRELAAGDFKSLSIYEILSMRYLVIQLVEAAAAICLYVMGELGERPASYPDCFARMGAKGLLPQALANRLAMAARLRNLLVHRYWEIDDERVHQSVREGLKDFEEFKARVRELLGHGRRP